MSEPPSGRHGDGGAPPVVAVVVTRNPGPWFEESLAAVAGQDYPDLSILVLDDGSAEDPTCRVAAAAPGAFVARLAGHQGFAGCANRVLEMVQGASHYLFLHDDVAPDAGAVHVLVEEAFRSNAGVVAPKHVGWHDPRRLVHVGLTVDKGGAVVDNVLPGELDHGQHDAVRDVFAVPGGCVLVRADLFEEIGGFDAAITAMGEDLDLCWRSHVAGARVVVAPGARVRHLEPLAGGVRPPGDVAADAPSLQHLQRRHELYAVLKTYTPGHLARVLPQLVVLSVAEIVVALATGNRQRASAVVHAWRWNVANRSRIRSARREVGAHRRVGDPEIRRLHVRGSARLSTYFRRAVTYGLHVAHLDAEAIDGAEPSVTDATPPAHDGPASPAADAEAPGASPDPERSGAGRLVGTWRPHRLREVVSMAKGDVPGLQEPVRSERPPDANRSLRFRATVWAVVVVAFLFGSRSLLAGGFPAVGQLLPIPSLGGLWHGFWSGWHPVGAGSVAPASPGLVLLGMLGTALAGSVGMAQTLVVLGCIPVGAIGVSRLLRTSGSRRGRMVATVIYLALPLPYDDLARGRWSDLVVYAAVPWLLAILARSARFEPLRPATPVAEPGSNRPWRHSQFGHAVAFGLVTALAASLAPQMLAVGLVLAAGLAVGSIAVGGWGSARAAGRLFAVASGGTVVAVVLLAPWSIGVLAGSSRWLVLFGVPANASAAPGIGALLRLGIGPVGSTPLAYAVIVAAALPLVVGNRWRLAWATRLWALGLVAWLLAWAAGRGWTGAVAVPVGSLLAIAALAMTVCIGLGVASLEADLPSYEFGWRQGASVVAGLAVAVGVLPVLGAVASGRWDLPPSGWRQATAFMRKDVPGGTYRVLWLGSAGTLPGASWPVGHGIDAALTGTAVPDVTSLAAAPALAPMRPVVAALHRAEQGQTVQVGQALAPFAIRYVVVVDSLAPTLLGYSSAVPSTLPGGLVTALNRQIDLQPLSGESGYEVFGDPAAVPVRAVDTAVPPRAPETAPSQWRRVLSSGAPAGGSASGPVPAGTLRIAAAAPGAWSASGPGGRPLERANVPGDTAPAFVVPVTETVAVTANSSWTHGLAVAVEVLLWLAAVAALAGRRWWLDWWLPSWRRRTAFLHSRGKVGQSWGKVGAVVATAPAAGATAGAAAAAETFRAAAGVEAGAVTAGTSVDAPSRPTAAPAAAAHQRGSAEPGRNEPVRAEPGKAGPGRDVTGAGSSRPASDSGGRVRRVSAARVPAGAGRAATGNGAVAKQADQDAPVQKQAGRVAATTAPVQKQAGRVAATAAPVQKQAGRVAATTAPVQKQAGRVAATTAPVQKQAGRVAATEIPVQKPEDRGASAAERSDPDPAVGETGGVDPATGAPS